MIDTGGECGRVGRRSLEPPAAGADERQAGKPMKIPAAVVGNSSRQGSRGGGGCEGELLPLGAIVPLSSCKRKCP